VFTALVERSNQQLGLDGVLLNIEREPERYDESDVFPELRKLKDPVLKVDETLLFAFAV